MINMKEITRTVLGGRKAHSPATRAYLRAHTMEGAIERILRFESRAGLEIQVWGDKLLVWDKWAFRLEEWPFTAKGLSQVEALVAHRCQR